MAREIPRSEGWELRRSVDERLREILLENRLDFDCQILEITGSLKERVEKVLMRFPGLDKEG